MAGRLFLSMTSVVQVIGNVAVGGAERHLLDLVRGLRKRGIRTIVVCPRPGPLSEALERDRVPLHYLEMVVPRPGDEYALEPGVVAQLTDWFHIWKPDVVHSHLYPAHLHASLAAVQAGVAAVVHTAHTLVVRPGDIVLSRLANVHTIATSRAAADLLVQSGVSPLRVGVIYNGVGTEHLEVEPEMVRRVRDELDPGPGPIVGTVARLSAEKGIDVFLQALPEVVAQMPTLTALIIGSGPQESQLRRLAAELDLDEVVRFVGARHDVAALNRLLDVFVLPSREEACPMALLEAMAAGRAVVATRAGGSSELVEHGVDGLLVPVDDPDALADAMLQFLSGAREAGACGAVARQKIVKRFCRERMIDQTLACYRRLLSQPP